MKNSVYEPKTTYESARAIHELCIKLKQTDMNDEQQRLIRDIDGEAFRIYTNRNVEYETN